MDWIFEHFNVVLIIAVVVGSILKSRFDTKTQEASEDEVTGDFGGPNQPDKSYRKTPPPPPSVPPAFPQTPMPPSRNAQPPPISTVDPSIPWAVASAADEAAMLLQYQQKLAAQLKQIQEIKVTTTGGAVATRARIASKGKAKSAMDVPLSVRARLKTPAEVRRAFVMNEILSRPVGLR